MIGVLSVMSVSLCAFALGMGGNGGEKACAANAASDFYMENGASVRIDDKAGVRFSTHISESRYNAVKETAGDKEVKLVTIVNRADLGATHGAKKAMEFEYNLAGVSAKDGEYTVIARVTYSALEESLLLNAASVELEAKCYLVIGNDWANAVAAESDDNMRSMRSVAYAALTAGAVNKADVEKYLGTVREETRASALLYTNAKAIDVSELTATYGDYTAAYIGAKKIGDVKNGKIDLAEAYNGTAETITLMDSANNVVTAPLKYAGDLSAEIKSHKYGSLAAMENGTVITLEKDGKQTTATVEGGKITAANLPAGTYSVKTNNYLNGELKITAGEKNENALTLEYDAFATTSGMEGWGSVRDFSKQNDGKITLDNDLQFIFSKKRYHKVAFSVLLQKDWNSAGRNGRQGVIFRFRNGDEYKGIAAMQTEGEKQLQSDGQTDYGAWWGAQGVGLNGSLDLAEGGGWNTLVNFASRTDFKAALNAGTLKLTVLRDGAVFYAYLNGEYVGCKSYAAKYADMECEAGFYYFDFSRTTTMRDWNFEVTEDTAELEAKIPAGSLNAAVRTKVKGVVTQLTDGQKVKIEGGVSSGEYTVTDGKISLPKMFAGTYKLSYGENCFASITIEKDTEYTSDIELQYKVFDLFKGWDEAQHDFSHVNDEKPTIGNNGKTLNVISHDSYNDVATSLWIKKGNSTHEWDVQGIVLKFSNGSYMFTNCVKMSDGTYKLQWVNGLWSLPIAKAQELNYQNPFTEAQNTAFESADGLQLTVVRSGNILTVYVNGEKVPGGSVVLDESYASMTVQAGFFDFDSKTNATWKFDIQSDISAYNTALEKTGSNEMQYNNNVNLTGDVWQAMKLKVNAGYAGDVRIGFTAWHNGVDSNGDKKGYVKSINSNNGNSNNGPWKLQETDSWKNEVTLSDEFKSALEGEGLYLAYHRDAATGYVKVYAGATKAALESAIKSKTALSTFTAEPELKKKEITVVGVLFWAGDYTASATGYSYGATSEAVLAKLV